MNVDDPAVVGVPDNTPAELNVTPAGNEPDERDHVYEPRPPIADRDCEYDVPVIPTGSEAVVTESGVAATEIENTLSAVRPRESVTRTVKVTVELVACEGVPAKAPVVGFSSRPAGGSPRITDQAYEPAPPVALSVLEYGTVRDAAESELVWITRGFTTRIDNDAVAVRPSESVARNVKVEVPVVVGVPTIDEPEIDRPAGSDPVATDHEYGARPPVAVSDWL